jgi:hypothetical protein
MRIEEASREDAERWPEEHPAAIRQISKQNRTIIGIISVRRKRQKYNKKQGRNQTSAE